MIVTLTENGLTKNVNVKNGDNIQMILNNNNINSETCIVSVNGTIAHPSYTIKENDKVEIIKIIYGG